MNDLIDRQAAIDELEGRIKVNGYSNVALVSELNRCIGYIMRLPSAQPEPQWIPCSKRLPNAQDVVIVSIRDETGDTAYNYTSHGWLTTDKEYWIVDDDINHYVVAWMPLPEPWKGEEE